MGTALPHLHKRRGRRPGRLGDRQRDQSQNHHPQNTQQPQSFDVSDRWPEQIKLKKEWDEMMDLDEKYGLDYYSSLESDSNFEPEHKYGTLI